MGSMSKKKPVLGCGDCGKPIDACACFMKPPSKQPMEEVPAKLLARLGKEVEAPLPLEPTKVKVRLRVVSASNAEAFVNCTTSHLLPQAESHNDYMYRGSEGHEPLAAKINKRVANATERGKESVRLFPLDEILSTLDVAALAETAYVVNVQEKSVRFVGKDIGREYGPLAKYEVPCTLDVQGVKDGRPWIRDWKFGKSAAWWQLMVQCMAAAYGSSPSDEPAGEIDAGFIFIDGDSKGKVWHEESRIVSLEEIDAACDRLVEAFDRVPKLMTDLLEGRPKTTAGEWCTYCPGYAYCPSKWALARAMTDEVQDVIPKLGALSQEELGALWAHTREFKKIFSTVEEALKGAALREPLPLPNGKELAMIEARGRETVDKDLARALVRRLGGTTEDFESICKRGDHYMMAKERKR